MIDKPRAQLGQLSWVVREYASWERLRRQALVARRMEMPNLPRRRRRIGEVWGVAMVRDELDVIGTTLDHLLSQGVDRVLVADTGSVDGTRELLEERARDDDRVLVGVDPIVAYYQAEKMTWLAHRAWRAGVFPNAADGIEEAEKGRVFGELEFGDTIDQGVAGLVSDRECGDGSR